MSTLLSTSSNQDSQRQSKMIWISGLLLLSILALVIGMRTQIDWNGHQEWLRTAVFSAFTLINSLRILAYIPQMLTAAKDTNGASGISYATWILFLVSHLTTISYAVVCVGDKVMALIFLGNALACLTVVAITFFKRRQYAIQLLREL